ncbi:MAG: hypothetical protein ACE5DT_04255 [Nitrosopumilus sp.]
MNDRIPEDLIHAAFFFIDIVGLSNPILSTETQRTKIKQLNSMIYDCQTFTEFPKNELYILPTGDGMLIGFQEGLEEPLSLAIELHAKLNNYNQQVPDTETIDTRIGCNTGHIFIVKDLFDNINLWGPGAILARRVMDLGNANHILLPSSMVNDLFELSDKYKSILHLIHNFTIKHGDELLLYSAYNENFGNETPPENSKQLVEKTISETKSMCQKMVFNVKLKDPEKTNLTVYERIYDFVNNSQEPIYQIQTEIMTHTKLNAEDLKIRALDESGKELEIIRISSPSDFSKHLTIKLIRPLFPNSEGQQVKLIYEKNEPINFFQHRFLRDADNFELNLITPYDYSNKQPNFIFIDSQNNKTLVDVSTKIPKGASHITTWKTADRVSINDIIRLEY